MAIQIVVDSSADLNELIRPQLTVVPLSIQFGDETFIDGITIDGHAFYEKLIESDALPTTSQATPYQFEQVFSQAVDAGHTVIAITVSAKLSGTYQSACIAAAEYPDKVFVVDSESIALGSGILAEYALELVKQGKSAAEIVHSLTRMRSRVHVLAMLDTLEYLKRGGRISKTVAFAGDLLSIKPVVSLEGGAIQLIGKARGSKQANNLLVKEIQKAGGVDFEKPVLLGYTGMTDVLLQKYITDSASLWEGHRTTLPTTIVGSVVGTHAGPGAVAVAFFSTEEASA